MLNIYVAEEKTSSHCVHRIVEMLLRENVVLSCDFPQRAQ